MSRALGLASTSKYVRSADWTVWAVSLLTPLILVGAASAQGAATQQTCVAGQSSLQVTRFRDNGDGSVTDVDSKLMWMRCSAGQSWVNAQCTGQVTAFNWPDAVREANQINRNGDAFFNDWRLPSLRDLATITDRGSGQTQCVRPIKLTAMVTPSLTTGAYLHCAIWQRSRTGVARTRVPT